MLRDSIDYKGTAVGKLFRRFLFPTVMGMVFSAVFVITDGIFVCLLYTSPSPRDTR